MENSEFDGMNCCWYLRIFLSLVKKEAFLMKSSNLEQLNSCHSKTFCRRDSGGGCQIGA